MEFSVQHRRLSHLRTNEEDRGSSDLRYLLDRKLDPYRYADWDDLAKKQDEALDRLEAQCKAAEQDPPAPEPLSPSSHIAAIASEARRRTPAPAVWGAKAVHLNHEP